MSLQSHRPATAFQAGLLKARNLSLLNSRSIRKQRSDWPDHASAYDVEHSLCLQCTQNNFLQVSFLGRLAIKIFKLYLQVSQTHESISIPLESPVPTSSNLKDKADATCLIGRRLPYGRRPTLNKERIKGSHGSNNREQTLLFETRRGVTTTRRVWYEVGAYVCNKESGGSEGRKVVYVYLGIYKMWQCIICTSIGNV